MLLEQTSNNPQNPTLIERVRGVYSSLPTRNPPIATSSGHDLRLIAIRILLYFNNSSYSHIFAKRTVLKNGS